MVDSALTRIANRLDFAALIGQQGRLLQVETALPTLALIAERLVLKEAVDTPFEWTLDCLSTSAHLELKTLIGEQVSVRLLQADGRYQPWHGYVVDAAQLGSDGGVARYRLTAGSWLTLLALRHDSFIYQDKTALEIVEDIFKDHPQAHHRIDVGATLRRRALCTQYRESDLAFVTRLLAEEGLSYHFEHLDGQDAQTADERGHARHVLVISDASSVRGDLGPTRFARRHVTANLAGQRDAVTAFMVSRRVAANAVAMGAWDAERLVGTAAEDTSGLSIGELPTLEIYDGAGADLYENPHHAERVAAQRLQALELGYKRCQGQGSARHFRAGATFSLIDHPLFGANTSAFDYAGAATASHQRPDNAFTLLAVEHHAANNLGAAAARLLRSTELEQGTYTNHFECAPAVAPVVPGFHRRPTAPGSQTALVVGTQGDSVTTDREHRVKVQFAWQRGERSLQGGLPHTPGAGRSDDPGNAPGDERSGSWLRVAEPAAGADWGAVFTPRVGAEVEVVYVEGDIDRPIIAGQVPNGIDIPPFAAGADSGVNHPGVISGVQTQGLDGSGHNQWVIDDACGQLRMRLHASYGAAEIGLGHLIQQQASGAQRGPFRGSGFEATTQGWVSLRAGQGMLVSTSRRAGSYGSAQSTQMDAAEAAAQLKGARELACKLSDAAGQAGAATLGSSADGQPLDKLMALVDVERQGRHADSVNGQAATKGDGRGAWSGAGSGSGAGGSAGAGAGGSASAGAGASTPVESFAAPVIVLDTPATAMLVTEAGILAYAGLDSVSSTQGDAHHTAAHTWASTSGGTTSWYTHSGGIKAYAAAGPLNLRAHADTLQILADREVTVTSVNDEICIGASTKIELVAGQSSITLDGGDIEFKTPGAFTVKGSGHAFLGGGSQAEALPALPVGQVGEIADWIELRHAYEDLEPVVGATYKVIFDDGSVRQGTLDNSGFVRIEGVKAGVAKVEYGDDTRAWTPPADRKNADFGAAADEAAAKIIYDKYFSPHA